MLLAHYEKIVNIFNYYAAHSSYPTKIDKEKKLLDFLAIL